MTNIKFKTYNTKKIPLKKYEQERVDDLVEKLYQKNERLIGFVYDNSMSEKKFQKTLRKTFGKNLGMKLYDIYEERQIIPIIEADMENIYVKKQSA